jgi:Arc/MetJ-type ribon-helix-helix transcriptional regulator
MLPTPGLSRVVERTASGSDVLCDTMKIFLCEYECMPKVSVEIPQELLDDLDEHVGDEGKFVNRSDAVRASIRKTLDMLDEIDRRHGRAETDEAESH